MTDDGFNIGILYRGNRKPYQPAAGASNFDLSRAGEGFRAMSKSPSYAESRQPERSLGGRLSDRDRRGRSLQSAGRSDGDAQQSGTGQGVPRSGARRRHPWRGNPPAGRRLRRRRARAPDRQVQARREPGRSRPELRALPDDAVARSAALARRRKARARLLHHRSWRRRRTRRSRRWRPNSSKRKPSTSISCTGCSSAIPSRARTGPTISIRRCRRNRPLSLPA